MKPTLVDTDVLSELLKGRNPIVERQALDYSRLVGPLTFSAVTRFEIMRGLKLQQATAQLNKFFGFCTHSVVLPVDEAVFDRASDLWVTARSQGLPHGDADLLIAATALRHGLLLATGNHAHFSWIAGLSLVDWRR